MRQLQADIRDDLLRVCDRLEDGVAAKARDANHDLALPRARTTTKRGATS